MDKLESIKLTTNQACVLVNAITAPNPQSAKSYIPKTTNAREAVVQLSKLGLIAVTMTGISATEQGRVIAREQNLVDNSDQPTELGNQALGDNVQPSSTPTDDTMPFESTRGFPLIKTLLEN